MDLVSGTVYFYWLDDVAMDGAITRHGPVSVTYLGPTAVTLGGLAASGSAPPFTWWIVAAALAAGLVVPAAAQKLRVGK